MRVQVDKLNDFIKNIFINNDLDTKDAEIIAHGLIEANLRGHASHGVLRTKPYVERIQKNGATKEVNIEVIKETEVSLTIDAKNGLGMPVAYRVTELVRSKAETSGIAMAVVKNSNHYGAAAVWADKMAETDMIAFTCTNTEALMAAPGGKDVLLGTNPICISVPTKSYGNVTLDLATSTVAQGKLFDYRNRNQEVPDGWAVDKDGKETNDPNEAMYLLPFAKYKGYGFAIMVEIFSAILAGGEFGKQVNGMYADIDKPNLVSHFFGVIKIENFRDTDEFLKQMDEFVEYIHHSPAAEGQKIQFPGEIEQEKKKRALEEGIELDETLIRELNEIAKQAEVPELKA